MPTSPNTLLCQYRYDPLDRLIGQMQSGTPVHQRFYCKSRLATEIQGATGRSIVQAGDQLLAQQQRQGDALDTTLLATDMQRSVLQTIKPNPPRQPIAYSPYGHHPAESGLTSLLGFNGERWDPVTGCYLLGNGYRAFNPVLMRFNSPDSWSPFGKGGFNSYAYCLGDPVNFFDPNGHLRISSVAKFIFWKYRAGARAVQRTRTIFIGWEKMTLNSNITGKQSVSARTQIATLSRVMDNIFSKNSRYLSEIKIAQTKADMDYKLLGIRPEQNDRLKLLNSIKANQSEFDSSGLEFSIEKLEDMVDGIFDPRLPLIDRPSQNTAKVYKKELLTFIDTDRAGYYEAMVRIRDEHFNVCVRASRFA
ncbi:RHS repeat-associated core domain-containing protein [Pseudomonas sp. Irchel s3b5]|uniref:RHS repeat-associated core domain-containing protein n=1 Tax=Pseudomonas sp. Irchel s3b5 TaxID=2009077 RepID=UPI000BA32BF6|nr:RHS repeat-associated core domain-containing protein [Pseudomonas sp. Irchel s3b5]